MPTWARHRENSLGSSTNVSAGPVNVNVGSPASSKPASESGDRAAGLATFRTPQSELIRLATFWMSRLSWSVFVVPPVRNERSWRRRRSMFEYHGLTAPKRSAIWPRFSLR